MELLTISKKHCLKCPLFKIFTVHVRDFFLNFGFLLGLFDPEFSSRTKIGGVKVTFTDFIFDSGC